MRAKKLNKQPKLGSFIWTRDRLREVDKSLYWLLQVMYDLKLISEPARNHGTTAETKLLTPLEDL